MANLLKGIVAIIGQALSANNKPVQAMSSTGGTDCTLPPDLEMPSEVSHDSVPTFDNERLYGGTGTFSAQAAGCQMTIRPELGEVNMRSGPGLQFEPPVASTSGSTVFEVVGAAKPAGETRMWFAGRLDNSAGWVRGDLVNLTADCGTVSYINPSDISAGGSTTTAPSGRFPLPTSARITNSYSTNHPGLDMGASVGTVLKAVTDGTCIRLIHCKNCTDSHPNVDPGPDGACPELYSDINWGYGYGNYIVMRHDYALLPKPLRDEMDRKGLTNGFAYILFAHLSRLSIELGQSVDAGAPVGATGNTGCSSGPHLHFEVRIGNVTDVDNKWSKQTKVNPNLMFEV